MCDLVSFWINVKTEQMVCRSLTSHSETQRLMGWSSAELDNWREVEWTAKSLTVRTHTNDEPGPSWHKAIVEARFTTRIAAINWAVLEVNAIGGDLDLGGLTSAKGLTLPQSIGGYLYLGGLTSAERSEIIKRGYLVV